MFMFIQKIGGGDAFAIKKYVKQLWIIKHINKNIPTYKFGTTRARQILKSIGYIDIIFGHMQVLYSYMYAY